MALDGFLLVRMALNALSFFWMDPDGSGWIFCLSGWFWIALDGFLFSWIDLDGCGWISVCLDSSGLIFFLTGWIFIDFCLSGWIWMNFCLSGYFLMALDGFLFVRMDLDGFRWIFACQGSAFSSNFRAFLHHVINRKTNTFNFLLLLSLLQPLSISYIVSSNDQRGTIVCAFFFLFLFV